MHRAADCHVRPLTLLWHLSIPSSHHHLSFAPSHPMTPNDTVVVLTARPHDHLLPLSRCRKPRAGEISAANISISFPASAPALYLCLTRLGINLEYCHLHGASSLSGLVPYIGLSPQIPFLLATKISPVWPNMRITSISYSLHGSQGLPLRQQGLPFPQPVSQHRC